MSQEGRDADSIWIHSHVSARDGSPYVVMNWGTLTTQWTIDEAVAHAHALLECAYSATEDALMTRVLGGDARTAGLMLARMRELRGSSPAASQKRSSPAVQPEDAE